MAEEKLDAFRVVANHKCMCCGMESRVLLERYDREGNRLADVVGTTRDALADARKELSDVLAENARLRRKLEKLEQRP